VEPYQEIVNIDDYFFFKGLADLKYSARKDSLLSDRSAEDHFKHLDYYEIEVHHVEKFKSTKDYQKWESKFQLKPIRNEQIIVHFDGNEFGVKADEIYIHESLFVNHVQIEDEFLHGDFYKVPVAFKMHKRTKKIICKPNYKTGERELREGEWYSQITTGEFDADGERCEMIWVKESIIDFTNVDSKDDEVTLPPPMPPPMPPPIPPGNKGCLNSFFLILAILWAVFCSYYAVKFGSFIPILLGIGVPLFLLGFGYVTDYLGRYSSFFSKLFNWIIKIFIAVILYYILKGIFYFITSHTWNSIPVIDNQWDNQKIIDTDSQDNFIDNDNGRKLIRDKVTVQLKWRDLNNYKYEIKYSLFKDEIASSTININKLKYEGADNFTTIYSNIYQNDAKYLNSLYEELDKIRVSRKQNNIQFANTIVSMVQSIDYVLILEQNCNDPSNLQSQQFIEMRNSGISCDGLAPFGLKTPLQFLSNLKGDCDTRTLLLYTIFKHYNYNVAIINSEYYLHSMLGLDLPGVKGVFKVYNGVKYYFWETTNKGFRIGELPRENGNVNYWNIKLN
jgi:hypothetical protein